MPKIFVWTMSVNCACSCHPEIDFRCRIVVAETEAQSLGFLLEVEQDTQEHYWSGQEIPLEGYAIYDEEGDPIKTFP